MTNRATITLAVTETTVYQRDLTVTPELLDEAEAKGYERNAYGVANMLDDSDGDHDEIVCTATSRWFTHVEDREANTEVN